MKVRNIQQVVFACGFLISIHAHADQTATKSHDAKPATNTNQFMPLPSAGAGFQQGGGGGIYKFCMQPGMNQQTYYNALNNTLGQQNGWEPVQFTQTTDGGVLCTVILFRRVAAK